MFIEGKNCATAAETIERTSANGNILYHITAGRKSLTVEIAPAGFANCWLETIKEADPVPGETTTVFATSKEVMAREAERLGLPIRYEFETGFSHMKAWALTTGQKIFEWTDIHPTIDDPEKIVAHALIVPQ